LTWARFDVSGLKSLKKSLGTGGADGSIGNMKTRYTTNRTRGFTWVELLVVIGVVALLAALLLPALAAAKRKAQRIHCVNYLMQIGMSFRIFEGDNFGKYPMQVILTNSETMKLITNGSAYVLWRTMSNELSTPFILHCPADTRRVAATNFATGFSDANISYFFSLDAVETYPNMILDGDDNLAMDGARVKPGILNLWPNSTIEWNKERHHFNGNIGLADGSVQQATLESWKSVVATSTSIAITNSTPSAWVIP
jgi:prepilin-type N-terminal cleavage/methylation domain-containing protein